MITAADLRARLRNFNAPEGVAEACVEQAVAMVTNFVGTNADRVPESVLDLASLEVAQDLYFRTESKNGISQFADGDGGPVRIARDPMLAAYAILRPFLPMGFA